MTRSSAMRITLGLAGMMLCAGCAVPQRPGQGQRMRLIEPATDTSYYLYLPSDYLARNGQRPDGRRWPMVVTLHGLRPYDNASWQNREWQEEADRYGFIIVAPDLRTCDSLTMQFPLRDPTLPYVIKDEESILAVMDEVVRRTNADPDCVLLTSFSSGGYLAHFMANRHPERFTVLAVRGSNFNANLLNAGQVPAYRDMPVAIFFGQKDLKVCRVESMEAVEWYRAQRFKVEAKIVNGLGHERRPQLAAAFFARAIGVAPSTPPDLGAVVMLDVPEDPAPADSKENARAAFSPKPAPRPAEPAAAMVRPASPSRQRQDAPYSTGQEQVPSPRPANAIRVQPVAPGDRPVSPAPAQPSTPTPKRPTTSP